METTYLLPKSHSAKHSSPFSKLLVAPALLSLAILSSLYVLPSIYDLVLDSTDSFSSMSFTP